VGIQRLEAWMARIRAILPVVPEGEFTVEVNPAEATSRALAGLRRMGVNRLSLGFQAMDDASLALLGRRHRVQDALEAFRRARKAGFDNVGIDLLYGLPGQSLEAWKAALHRVVALHPEHLSLYPLTLEPGTLLWRRVRCGDLLPAEEETVADMFTCAVETLEQAGFIHYELSNFAREGRQCRHNLNVWRHGRYLGLGAGAHSHWDTDRWANHKDPRRYADALARGEWPVAERETLDAASRSREALLLGLRLREGVALDRVFGTGQTVPLLQAEGLVEVRDGRLRLTRKGQRVADAVILALL